MNSQNENHDHRHSIMKPNLSESESWVSSENESKMHRNEVESEYQISNRHDSTRKTLKSNQLNSKNEMKGLNMLVSHVNKNGRVNNFLNRAKSKTQNMQSSAFNHK